MRNLKRLGIVSAAALSLMALLGVASASATTLTVNGVAKNSSVSITMSLASGTSLIVKDSFGTTTDTCTESTVKEATEGAFSGSTVSGKVSTMTFGKCSHTTTVISPGRTHYVNIGGTSDTTIYSTETEITIVSTAFGASAVCKTGSGTHIGTLTGWFFSFFSIMDYSSKTNCGILGTATVTGQYTVTSPEKLASTS